MDLSTKTLQICVDLENKQNANRKRDLFTENEDNTIKKPKLTEPAKKEKESEEHLKTTPTADHEAKSPPHMTRVHQSPKKRLDVNVHKKPSKEKFIYGNYSQYYGYRNKNKDFHDIRLDIFETHSEIFRDKEVLDIGCNSGFITMEIAKRFAIKNIVGIDIDRGLINQAHKSLVKQKKALPQENEARRRETYPYNVKFQHGNYVLRDDVLLEMERPQFDVILCLSITKWIHLNFGDAGLKQAFRRIFLQLRIGGTLILEAQPFDNYGRRKNMTNTIFANYKEMQFFPKQFTEYLLSPEVGFKSVKLMGVPEKCAAGFKRPIQIFRKE